MTTINSEEKNNFIEILKKRFVSHKKRHADITWDEVLSRLESSSKKLEVLKAMEDTGGEPDVIKKDSNTKEILFYDCSKQSPSGRRSYCYDKDAWESRKKHKPINNAIDAAAEIGIEILNEDEYRHLQTLGEFDTTTSSWVKTPEKIRSLGGALFCDRRFNHVFTYHNGAESYYSARGFRGFVRV